MKALALFSTPLAAVLAMLFAVVVVMAPVRPAPAIAAAASTCVPQASDAVSGVHLDRQQWQVARDVIDVGIGAFASNMWSDPISLPIFLFCYFSTLAIAWVLAVRIAERMKLTT